MFVGIIDDLLLDLKIERREREERAARFWDEREREMRERREREERAAWFWDDAARRGNERREAEMEQQVQLVDQRLNDADRGGRDEFSLFALLSRQQATRGEEASAAIDGR